MFVPPQYRPRGRSWTLETVRSNPLAMLVTRGERALPWITHLPVITHPERPPAELPGATLLGHMNAANPHWAAVASGGPGTLVFTGPHGYVSPTVYELPVAAPTWDFVAVHVHGTLRPLDTPEDARRVVRWTVEAYEGTHGTGWDPEGSLDYFDKILPGVRAFEFHVESVDGMYKLSQEQEPETRRRVVRSFAASGRGAHAELSALIDRFGDPGPGAPATGCPAAREAGDGAR